MGRTFQSSFMDIFPREKPPKIDPLFKGPFIFTSKLDRGAVETEVQGILEEN